MEMHSRQSDGGPPVHQVSRIRQNIIESSLKADLSEAMKYLDHSESKVRASSLVALDGNGKLDEKILHTALLDTSFEVRSTLAYLSSKNRRIPIENFLIDIDPAVVEIACWAIGERGEASDFNLLKLQEIVESHDDALCRESAVAALGALGNKDTLSSILKAVDDIATVRRRAVLALSPFDGPEVEEAIQKALEDRDWQVRQAAEDIAK
tara:strand:+ start:117 stop:743 length:627 start_codon:yes stop_codon:yes gene_type:complete